MHRWSKYSLTSENIGIYEEIFENVQIIDCHTHIGRDRDGHKLSADQLIKVMKKANIDKAISFPLNDPRNSKTFSEPNDAILLAAKVYKDKIVPFFRLNPNAGWKTEFNTRVEQGFKGVKLHPRSQNFKLDSAKVFKVYEECEKNRLIVLMHTGFGLETIADDLLSIKRSFPKLKLIIGHSGFVDIENMIKKLGNEDNVLFDTSTVKMFDLFDLLKKVDYHKIAFGSDAPYYDMDLALECLIDAAITVGKTANQIKKLLGGNMQKWLE
ncbi:amidohydrolase family protein [Candidatus Woesearchaeota archaeon]|nr:amidohydrolase family protein [Candidatus Woesearchaeota archaeon]